VNAGPFAFQWALVAVNALWAASEAGLLLFRRANASASRQDAGSLRLLLVVIYLCVALGVVLGASGRGRLHLGMSVRWLGLAMILAGLVLRWWAIFSLRRFFTVDVAIHPGQRLVQTGPYRYLRHPSYAGALLSFVGLALCLSSWLAALAILVPIAGAFYHRIRIEERALQSAFPNEYRDYCGRTSRIVPGIY
jgi:protein-S-isoprenylcysteine O-methyltransferase